MLYKLTLEVYVTGTSPLDAQRQVVSALAGVEAINVLPPVKTEEVTSL